MKKHHWPEATGKPDPVRQEIDARARILLNQLGEWRDGDKLARTKDAFIHMLEECGVPPALRLLAVELVTDQRQRRRAGAIDRDHNYGLTDQALICAAIEASNPSISTRAVSSRLSAVLGADKDHRRDISRWRAKPGYPKAVGDFILYPETRPPGVG